MPKAKPAKPENRRAATLATGAASQRGIRPMIFGPAIVRSLHSMLVVCVLTTAGYGVYKALPYVSPKIQRVAVSGDMKRLDQPALARAVHDNLRGGILTLDIEYLRSEIAKIAWVESVELVRHFPATLAVHIVEEQAVARWNDRGYISHKGEFIDSTLYEDLSALPLLSSALKEGDPRSGARESIEIFHMLNSTALMYGQLVQELHQNTAGGWTMIWDNGLSIDLGRVDHLNRTRHVMAAWQRLPDDVKNNIDRIDARYDNGVAISHSERRNQQGGNADRSNNLTEPKPGAGA